MCNFFAQPDALAVGKSIQELKEAGVPEILLEHKMFSGNRPSISLLFGELNPYTCGQLLAIYEHMVATGGFVYNVNSFDQWGVELGKVLAVQMRKILNQDEQDSSIEDLNEATRFLVEKYLEKE